MNGTSYCSVGQAPKGAMNTIALTVYRGALNTTPIAHDKLTWPQFCGKTVSLCIEESKALEKTALAFGPYRLRAGATHSTASVVAMSRAIALDVDGLGDLAALQRRIIQLDLSAIVHGTPSDDPAGVRKVRIYVLADAEHAPSEAGAVRDSVAALLGVTHDSATRNADSIFTCGRLAGTPPRFVWRHDGKPLQFALMPRAAHVDFPNHKRRTP